MNLMEIKIDVGHNTHVITKLNENCSADELLGFAEVIKKIKKALRSIGNIAEDIKEKSHKRFASEELIQIANMKKEKKSAKEIAEILNRDISSIYNKISLLKKEGKI